MAQSLFALGGCLIRYSNISSYVTKHVCRHTYCSNMARSGMNPKTLQYLMGHSEIGVTMNVYTHLGLDAAASELARLNDAESARLEQGRLLQFYY